jgi:Uma2 family endonuclease
MLKTLEKTISLEEFLEFEETKPYSEYIDGEIIQKSMPQGKHSRIQAKLTAEINAILEPSLKGLAFPELRCTFADRSIVPDLAIFSWSRIPIDSRGNINNIFAIAPDWIVEILSPDQAQTKVIRKILHSLEHGSEMGWLIEPEDECVTVYTRSLDNRNSLEITVKIFEIPENILSVPTFANQIHLTIGNLFGWNKL